MATAAARLEGRGEALADSLDRIFVVGGGCLGQAPGRVAVAAVQLSEGLGVASGGFADQL
jgi:hypothetical protein